MAKPKNTTSDTKQFGSERTMAPKRIKDTDAPRGRQLNAGQHTAQGRPPLMKK